jgi:hypothetical protein
MAADPADELSHRDGWVYPFQQDDIKKLKEKKEKKYFFGDLPKPS